MLICACSQRRLSLPETCTWIAYSCGDWPNVSETAPGAERTAAEATR